MEDEVYFKDEGEVRKMTRAVSPTSAGNTALRTGGSAGLPRGLDVCFPNIPLPFPSSA